MLSASRTVLSRCATMTTVLPRQKVCRCSMISRSLLASRALVASSEEEEFRVLVDGAGNQQPLFLSLADAVAPPMPILVL